MLCNDNYEGFFGCNYLRALFFVDRVILIKPKCSSMDTIENNHIRWSVQCYVEFCKYIFFFRKIKIAIQICRRTVQNRKNFFPMSNMPWQILILELIFDGIFIFKFKSRPQMFQNTSPRTIFSEIFPGNTQGIATWINNYWVSLVITKSHKLSTSFLRILTRLYTQ